jgi:hypothetical protein
LHATPGTIWSRIPADVRKAIETFDLSTRGDEQVSTHHLDAFKTALNNACGEINEAGRLASDIFSADELAVVRRELARLMEIIDSKILARVHDDARK